MTRINLAVKYLNQDHLTGFENYKYSSLDTSPLSIYVMHPFWEKVIKICPTWIAPNLLTFSGFLFTVLNFVLFSYYDYYFYASSKDHPEYPPIPSWVFALAAFNVFMAYTLDGIDGKQARRTQTTGPLGELFDHGLDSWTAGVMVICIYSVFGRTDHSVSAVRMYFILWYVCINFYLSHWEKYNTGILFLPWGYDASMLGTILAFILTSINGPELWKFELPFGITGGVFFELVLYTGALVSNIPVVVWNIYKSYRDKTGKNRTIAEALRPLVPLIALFTIATVWVLNSSSNIVEADPRVVYFIVGTIFSNICCRLIVSQMSNTRCEIFPLIILPIAGAALISHILPQFELEVMYLMAMFAFVAHIHYGTCVVRQMCHHFRISTFRIREHSE
ncbi:ethanolaminephosphotransferase 1-like [Chelonus insularis]|uniref:ethanolaminephosphotransferase 1-like n=1 Tax=Chelonus insularis TaxID=460826 RepID=UPI00158EA167|nr:ethanolaminephosphotransferase 1-like [Chelonus insularis]